jgi:hypothetical protein
MKYRKEINKTDLKINDIITFRLDSTGADTTHLIGRYVGFDMNDTLFTIMNKGLKTIRFEKPFDIDMYRFLTVTEKEKLHFEYCEDFGKYVHKPNRKALTRRIAKLESKFDDKINQLQKQIDILAEHVGIPFSVGGDSKEDKFEEWLENISDNPFNTEDESVIVRAVLNEYKKLKR